MFDTGVDEITGMPFLCMELLRGEELSRRIKRLGSIPEAEVALYLHQSDEITDARGIFEALSTKLGVVLLVLGVMHLGNVYVLNRIRRRGVMEREQVPPVRPTDWAAPTAGA